MFCKYLYDSLAINNKLPKKLKTSQKHVTIVTNVTKVLSN